MNKMTDSAALAALDEAIRITDRKTDWMDALKAARAHIAARLREPAGVGGEWVLVPQSPTPEMIEAGIMFGTSPNKATIIFQSMANAAPQPPAEAQDKWKSLIGTWQRRAEAAGYEGVEGAMEAAEAQAQGGGEVG